MSDPSAAQGRGEGKAEDDMGPRPVRPSRHSSEIVQILIIYALSVFVISIYSIRAIEGAPRFPGSDNKLSLALLSTIPLALAALFFYKLRGLLVDLRKRHYGARLRIRLVGLFLLAILVASLPQGLVLLRLARSAQASSASTAIRSGLSGGLELILDYYADDARRLEYAARHDLPLLAPGRLPNSPDKALDSLRAREPRMDAIEVFVGGQTYSFAGDIQARLFSAPAGAVAGPLAADAKNEVVRLRYLLPWGGPGGSIVLSLRLPDGFGANAAALSKAKTEADLLAPFSARWLRFLALVYILLVLPLLLLAALLGLAAADFLLEPLLTLETATKRIASGDLGLRLLVKPGDETGRLVASFNRMLSEIDRYRQGDLRKGKIDAWKDIAQRLAHELRNPLTPIRLAAERLLRVSKSDPERAKTIIEPAMLAIIAEVEGMTTLLTEFRSFASLPEPDKDWTDLRGIVADSVCLYAASYPEVEFDYEAVPSGTALRADKAQLKRVFANLFLNSIEAMGGKGRIVMRSDLVKTADSRYCRIRVGDSGPGIEASIIGSIFSPYFTTKSNGTGLGLAIVERIVADHGGAIRCESEPGAGASFLIDLPLDR